MVWLTESMSNVAAVQSGSAFPKKHQGISGEKYPFYKVSDMNLSGNEESMYFENNTVSEDVKKELRSATFPPGSIVFPKVGAAIATNKKRILTKVACVDNNVMGVIPFEDKLNPRFLFYWLQQHDLSEFANEADLPSIKKTTVENWPVSYPEPVDEQKRIVAILDQAFADIEQARAKTEQNLRNARDLFESYLQQVFSQRGEGWVKKTLKEASLDFGRGKSRHRPRNDQSLYGGDYPFIQTGDVRNCEHIIASYSKTYNEKGLAQSKLWPEGTICITVAANIAETGILSFEGCFPDSVIGVVVDPEVTTIRYVEYLLQSFKAILQAKGQGSAQDNINMGTFEKMKFPFPSIKKQKEIVSVLDKLMISVQNLERIYSDKLAGLDELKKSILHLAFTGQLTPSLESADGKGAAA